MLASIGTLVCRMGTRVASAREAEIKNYLPTPRKLSLAVAFALSAYGMSSASAAGLGRLTVQTALGQPLRAEVEITSLSREEASSLSARLASADSFRQAGLD